MSSRIQFRLAEEKDAKELSELEKLCFPDPWSENELTHDLKENPLSEYFLAEECDHENNKRIVGYLAVWWIRDEGSIINVAVHPAWRRRGIARLLMQRMFDAAKARLPRVESYTLEVRCSNEPAIELYKAFGFRIEGLRQNYYPDHEDAYIMWKLDPALKGERAEEQGRVKIDDEEKKG